MKNYVVSLTQQQIHYIGKLVQESHQRASAEVRACQSVAESLNNAKPEGAENHVEENVK